MYSDIRLLDSVYMLKERVCKSSIRNEVCVLDYLIDQSNSSPLGIVVVKDPIVILGQCCAIIHNT